MSIYLQEHRKRVGRRIKTARLAAGLSHDRLAARVGTSRQHLIRLERGDHLPRPAMLGAIARETGCDESFFSAESDDDEESDPVATIAHALDLMLDRAIARHAAKVAVSA